MKKSFLIINEFGLHARPAANFVRHLSTIPAHITIECENIETDAKSMMSVVSMKIVKNQVITLTIDQEEPSFMERIETYLIENQIAEPVK